MSRNAAIAGGVCVLLFGVILGVIVTGLICQNFPDCNPLLIFGIAMIGTLILLCIYGVGIMDYQ